MDRLSHGGPECLAIFELFAVALSSKPEDVAELLPPAIQWIKDHGAHSLRNAGTCDLQRLSAMSPFEVQRLKATLDLGRRLATVDKGPQTVLTSPQDTANLFRFLETKTQEHFCAAYLDTRNAVIASRTIHIGTLNMSVVGPREIFREAIREGAASLVVAHNHPSGDPEPSREDISVTQVLAQVGEMLDIPLRDHVIIYRRGFTSLRMQGHL
jgi:DNA repair protein RadC